jgi:glycosyltransferase involved in cell wall biosynthesis
MKICTLITTFNRASLLNNSLERMCNLTKPDEVLVVDDGSSDNTKEVVESFKDRLPIRYIYNNNPEWTICSFARNIGVKNTDCELIITTEPEMIWITDIIPIILEERKKYPDEIISASIIYHAQQATKFNPGLITDPVSALKSEIVEEYQTEPRSYHPSGYCKTTNMQAMFICSYEKKWIMDVGGWDEEFPGCWGWDDVDLATRLRVNGINQHVCTKLQAIHQFHGHPAGDVWARDAHLNDIYFTEKHMLDKNSPFLIANKGKEWGVIK